MDDIEKSSNRKTELIKFLTSQSIGNLATLGKDIPNLATVFFVCDGKEIYFKSRTSSTHSNNLYDNEKVSFTVYSHESTYKSKYGIQLKGKVARITEEPTMSKVVGLYTDAFKGSGAKLPPITELCSEEIKSTFYRLLTEEFKIIDESESQNRTMLEYEKFG